MRPGLLAPWGWNCHCTRGDEHSAQPGAGTVTTMAKRTGQASDTEQSRAEQSRAGPGPSGPAAAGACSSAAPALHRNQNQSRAQTVSRARLTGELKQPRVPTLPGARWAAAFPGARPSEPALPLLSSRLASRPTGPAVGNDRQ